MESGDSAIGLVNHVAYGSYVIGPDGQLPGRIVSRVEPTAGPDTHVRVRFQAVAPNTENRHGDHHHKTLPLGQLTLVELCPPEVKIPLA